MRPISTRHGLLFVSSFVLCVLLGMGIRRAQGAEQGVAPGAPVDLSCEFITNPPGIDTPKPRLSWVVTDSDRGELQTAYRILVSSTQANADKNVGDIWDTQKVTSDEQTAIVYAGTPLTPRTRYWWKVMTYDKDGNASPWSNATQFRTGFFGTGDWPSSAQFCSNAGLMRRKFALPETSPVAEAMLYTVSGGGKQADIYVYLNGEQAAPLELRNPGQMSGQDVLYRSLDVKSLLKAGDNVVAIMNNVGGIAVLLDVKFEDGSAFSMGTDSTWKTTKFASVLSAGKNSENYDARNDIEGWKELAFDDSAWEGLKKGGPIKKNLKSLAVPMTIHTTFPALKITQPQPGVWVVDFGQNMTGIPVITVNNARAGQKISYQPNESLHPDGTVKIQGCNQLCTYICKGGAEETIRPYFAYQGFRYLQIDGYPGTLTADKVKALAACSDLVSRNKFECSIDLVNRIYRLADWGSRNNLISIPTDCPTRERTGWMGDAWFCIGGQVKLFRMHKFNDHFMRLIQLNQDNDGALPYSVPFGGNGGSRFTTTCPVWGAANIIIPWYDYLEYGDKQILIDNYAMNKKWVDFLVKRSVDYHLVNHKTWGDWVSAGSGPTNDFVKDAIFYRAADILSQIATELGRSEDAKTYAKLAGNIKEAFNTAYLKVDETSKLHYYDNRSQGAQATAIYYGLTPDAAIREEVGKTLVDQIEKRKDHLGTGAVTTEALPSALVEIGRNDKMWAITNQPTGPGWGGWVTKHDATTAFEGWGGANGSMDHGFLAGSVAEWLYEELAGVKPVKPGYKEIQYRPYLAADLTFATAEVNTVKGLAKSSWKITTVDGKRSLKLNIVVPVNAHALVYVPTSNPETVTEGNGPAVRSFGVTVAKAVDKYAVYSVGSGTYEFGAELPALPTVIGDPRSTQSSTSKRR